ncbi:MAG: VPLPA-CTERM-specific exosortase XrtD [Pseudomonadota bacterium]
MSIAVIVAAIVAACLWQHEAVDYLVYLWGARPEFSHGPLLPLLAIWLAWRKRGLLAELPRDGVLVGVSTVALGALVVFLGDRSALMSIVHYGLVVMICGLVIAWLGARAIRHIWLPLLLLFLAIPLPNFILNNLSSQLQLMSSQLGVGLIRLFGVSVSLDGNVIDLGEHKLEVAAACDGLRYLFPLITLSFVMAYFYRAPLWKRAVLFASSIPLAIIMNGVRVGSIGLLVERFGIGMAEGLFHEFQGWLMFMFSGGILLVEIILMSRLGGTFATWRSEFGLDPPVPLRAAPVYGRLTPALGSAAALVLAVAVVGMLTPERVDAAPTREDFTRLSMSEGAWTGRRDRLDGIYLETLKLDDYLLADFNADGRPPVNLYVAYYNSQRRGESVHSPRSCIPGGGWHIEAIAPRDIALTGSGGTLSVNRVVIERGDVKQVVYYWFDQRGRVLTSEYLVKWYIFWDSLTRNRTDGAMLRLTVPVRAGQSEADADRTLEEFARALVPALRPYIPT